MTTGERPKLIPESVPESSSPASLDLSNGDLMSDMPETIATTEASAQDAADILARTIWAEARGEGKHGMEAVAAVIMNRLTISRRKGGHYWWGNDIIGICKAPWQFSCWNPGDPNLPKLLHVGQNDPVFASALRIARRAVNGLLDDPTVDVNTGVGATHYHHRSMQPKWARGHRPISSIGNHVFYALES